jgi:hypothetical protein
MLFLTKDQICIFVYMLLLCQWRTILGFHSSDPFKSMQMGLKISTEMRKFGTMRAWESPIYDFSSTTSRRRVDRQ